jgi:membrane protease subunit (stomatin/prohibitin family)
MGLWGKLKGEFIDIVEWLDPTNDIMVHRFERYNNEIKNNAKLVVRESQAAVFVREGQIADVMSPGMYTLDTKNIPILATLLGWKYGFESPFKCEVYFVNTKKFTDRKWGTKNPVMMRDAEFGPVRLRAFGTYALRVKDPATFIRQIAGTDGRFTVDEIQDQLRNMIVSRFADALGEAKIPALDLAANYNELGEKLAQILSSEFETFGLEACNLLIENISLPPEVEAAMDKRTSMGVIGNLQAFTQFQTANSIPDAAKNPGGLAAVGAGFGMGAAMAGQVSQSLHASPSPAHAMPPPLPQAAAWFAAINNQQVGPLDLAGLQQQAASGQLSRETLVWKAGLASWLPAGQVSELAGIFAQMPPPLPPPLSPQQS